MTFTIQGRLPNLNEAIDMARRGKIVEARFRKEWETMIAWCAKRDLKKWKPQEPVILHYRFYEPNRRRDKDNIASYATKLIQDALRESGYLSGDGWNQILNFDFKWFVDAKHPRIEVEIEDAVESNSYDVEEQYNDCTVQILRNTITGEHTWGWWENGDEPKCLNLSQERW